MTSIQYGLKELLRTKLFSLCFPVRTEDKYALWLILGE